MTPNKEVSPYGQEYLDEDWPHGLMCMDCDKVLQEGDRYGHRLVAMTSFAGKAATVEEIICLECALGGNDADR